MTYDTAVIGGGILGLAAARAIARRADASVVVLESEPELGFHQSGHNSGVIHSGLYYKPGSLKARTCAQGRDQLYAFCEEHEIAHDRCGKLVVATSTDANGRAAFTVSLPNQTGLIGAQIHTQWVLFDTAANNGGLITSNAASIKIGRQ